MPRKGQTKILDHFSPRSKAKYPIANFKTGIPADRYDSDLDALDSDQDSEGSQGLETIQLSAKKTERVQNGTLSQKRKGKRAVLDEEDDRGKENDGDEDDENESEFIPLARREAKAGPSRIQISPTPISDNEPQRRRTRAQLPIPMKYGRQPQHKTQSKLSALDLKPLTRKTCKSNSPAQTSEERFHIEVPKLSPRSKSRYSPWGSQPPEASASENANRGKKRPSPEVVIIEDDDEAPVPIPIDEESDDDHMPLQPRKKAKTRSIPANARPSRSLAPKSPNIRSKSSRLPSESVDDDEDDIRFLRKPKGKLREVNEPSIVKGKRRAVTPPESGRKVKKKAKKHDPDEEDDVATEEEEDMVAGIQMDEPSRFKSKTRLRPKKETEFQANLRRLRRKQLGIVDSSTNSEEEDSDEESEEGDGLDNFIIQDGKQIEDGLLPHQFSLNFAQTPEFKFKVAFHYFLLLAMEGPKILPLKGQNAEYFLPQLNDIRRRMDGFKDGRVRSQIWERSFVQKLEKYPEFETRHLEYAEPGCDACRIGQRMSTFRVHLQGEPYDRKTHEPLDDDTSSSSSSDSDDSEAARGKETELLMGKYCYKRAQCFHRMSHWEHELLDRIRLRYHDMLRAKGRPVPDDSDASASSDDDEDKQDLEVKRQRTKQRVDNLRRSTLPTSYKSVDDVLLWTDKTGFLNEQFRWLESLEEQSGKLEHDKSKDD